MEEAPPRRPEDLFASITAQYQPALKRLCLGYERTPALQEELFQEILLGLWRSLSNYRGDCSLRTWTFRVAHNVSLRHVERERRRSDRAARALDETDLPPASEQAADTAEQRLDRSLALERMQALVTELRPLDRQSPHPARVACRCCWYRCWCWWCFGSWGD